MNIHVVLATVFFISFNLFATDLISNGNQRAFDRYNAYKSARESAEISGCSSKGNSERRVLLTGFGPFVANQANISGLVVDSISDEDFWADELSSEFADKLPSSIFGSDRPGKYGGRAKQRTLIYNGEEYEVCFVILEVQWDLAGAIALFEAAQFVPDFVLMTGFGADRTKGRLEDVALNKALGPAGYDGEGVYSGMKNAPKGHIVLPDGKPSVYMTWNPNRLIDNSGDAMDSLNRATSSNFGLTKVSGASPNNTYICNNISYIMLKALANKRVKLAGRKLALGGNLSFPEIRAGFFHFPKGSQNSGRSVWGWSHVIFSMIEGNY
jgi:pyrrolidone-carboxylate peptidase